MKIPVISEPMHPNQNSASPKATLLAQVDHLNTKLSALPKHEKPQRATILLKIAKAQLDLKQPFDAWLTAKEAFQLFILTENWHQAVEACNTLFETEQAESLCALGQGLWLAVTFPIDIDLTVTMLSHIVDETPDDYDAAAVAAATAAYLVDMRADESRHEELTFFTGNLLGQVARRHSSIESQDAFESWVKRLELDDPKKFLPRLKTVIEVLIRQDDWWFNPEALQQKIPED